MCQALLNHLYQSIFCISCNTYLVPWRFYLNYFYGYCKNAVHDSVFTVFAVAGKYIFGRVNWNPFHPKTKGWGFLPLGGFSSEEMMIFVLRVLEKISTCKTVFIVNALQIMMLSSCNSVPGQWEINSTIPALCLSISIVNKAFFVSM